MLEQEEQRREQQSMKAELQLLTYGLLAALKGLKEQGKTILLASHNQGDIDDLCDTVCEMDAGVMTIIREESI